MAKNKKPAPYVAVKSPRDPQTPSEWQEAVNAADFMLRLDAARAYGLVTGGPDVDIERCADLLRRGKNLSYKPKAI